MRKSIKKFVILLISILVFFNINYTSNAFTDRQLAEWAISSKDWFLKTDIYSYNRGPGIELGRGTIRLQSAACIDESHNPNGTTGSYIMSSTIEIDNNETGLIITSYNNSNGTMNTSKVTNANAVRDAAFLAAMIEDVASRPDDNNLDVLVNINLHIFMNTYSSDPTIKHMANLFGDYATYHAYPENNPWNSYWTSFSGSQLSKKVIDYANGYRSGGGVDKANTTPKVTYTDDGETVFGPYKLIFKDANDLEYIDFVSSGKKYSTTNGNLKIEDASGKSKNLKSLKSGEAFYLKVDGVIRKFDSLKVRAKGGGTRAKIILFAQCQHQRIGIFAADAGTGKNGTELPLPVPTISPIIVAKKYVYKVERYNSSTKKYENVITNKKVPYPIVKNAGTKDAALDTSKGSKGWTYPKYDDVDNEEKFINGMPLVFNNDKITYKWVFYNIGQGDFTSANKSIEDKADYGLDYQGSGWTNVAGTNNYKKNIKVGKLHGYIPQAKGTQYENYAYFESTDSEITFKVNSQKFFEKGGKANSDNLIVLYNNGLPVIVGLNIRGKTFIDKVEGKEQSENGYYNSIDGILKDVKVYLYTKDNPNTPYENSRNKNWKNPTTVDKDGNYEFERLDPTKSYFVRFEYNGMYYMPTTYDVQTKGVNSTLKSYASEYPDDRIKFNKKFETINGQTSDVMKNYPSSEVNETFKISAYTGGTDSERKTHSARYYDVKMSPDILDHVNLGVIERPKFDLSATKDGIELRVESNNVPTYYPFNSLENKADQAKEVELKGADLDPYVRYLRRSDLNDTDENGTTLKMEIDYKIVVRNNTNGMITAKVPKLRDWFDKALKLKTISIDNNVLGSQEYTQGEDGEYNCVDINREIVLQSGERANLVIKFEINTTDSNLPNVIEKLLSAEGQATGIVENNFIEIRGYSTYYTNEERDLNGVLRNKKGEIAGLIDIDSVPENFNPNDNEVQEFIKECDFPADHNNPKYPAYEADGTTIGKARHDKSVELFEDDADRAPGVILKIAPDERHIQGNAFVDGANKELLQKPYGEKERLGDGLNNSVAGGEYIEDKNVQGIKVTLWEDFGAKGISDEDREVKSVVTDENGNYDIVEFTPGRYYLTYEYGTKEANSTKGTLDTSINNGNMYNGQDYKSTKYIDGNHGSIEYNDAKLAEKTHAWWYVRDDNHSSDARDDMDRRKEINDNCKVIKNYLAETLNGARIDELEQLTKMTANTNFINIEVDYPINQKYDVYQQNEARYIVGGINFGIIERPRNEMFLEEKVTRVQIVSTSTSADVNGIQVDAYADLDKNLYGVTKDLNNKVNGVAWTPNTYNHATRNRTLGHISITLDDTLRHGSTLYVYYTLIAENRSENNYVDDAGNELETYYNTGARPAGAKVAKISAGKVVNYVSDDLVFVRENNRNTNGESLWQEIAKADRYDDDTQVITLKANFINNEIKSVKKLETVVEGTEVNKVVNKEFAPGEKLSEQLILQQTLSAEGDQGPFKDSTEVVVQKSDVGRRSYGFASNLTPKEDNPGNIRTSIPGNLDPELVYPTDLDQSTPPEYIAKFGTINEYDAAAGEPVDVIPPFGSNKNYIPMIVTGIAIIAIFGIGIYFIKKKVL